MKIKPLFDRVLVQNIKKNDGKSAGGLFIPELSQEKSNEFLVVAVGPTCKELKVGDIILLNKYSGTDVEINNEKFQLIKEEDAIAILETDKKKGK